MNHDVPARGGSAPEVPSGAIAVADDAGAELIRRYEERLARDPASLAWAPLADAHRKAGRPRQAIELCREGLRRFPHYHTARLILAKALVEEGDGEAALAELGTALDAGARDAGTHRLASEIHRKAGRLEPATAHLVEAVRLDPEDREARLALDSLRAAGQVPEASPLAGLLADDTFATLAFGALCLEQGLAEEAAQIFLRLLRHDPGNARAREGLDQALRVKTQRRKGP